MGGDKIAVKYTKLFINNEFVDAKSGKKFADYNPCDEQLIAHIAEADAEDVDLAVAAARTALSKGSSWSEMDASERGKLLFKLADLIERDRKYLEELESLDNGKPLCESQGDISAVINTFRFYAGVCDKIHGKTIPSDGGNLTMTLREPIGVVGQIIPWNYPLMMVAWKWGPALAAGCTIVMKPAEQTSLTVLYAAALIKEAGFPPGVVNVLPGMGSITGAAIALHPDIDKIAFTGSIEVGKKIMEYAAQSNLKKVSLELGGKSPLVIMDDVDVNKAAQIAYEAVFANHGQNCCAGTRTFVHEKIYGEFVKNAVELARARKVGHPFDPTVEQGPQVDRRMLDKVLKLVQSGIKQGAVLETGGSRIGGMGYFVEPTVFSNVKDHMKIAQEEIFGPVQCIFQFKTLNEAITRANNSRYGLAAGILTENLNNALQFSREIRAGSIWINCYDAITPQTPFGGYKMSGIGRELGVESVYEYMEIKLVSIKMTKQEY